MSEDKREKTPIVKRILAWVGIVIIALWLTATLLIAALPIPNKAAIFPFFIIGCIVFPVFLWIAMWAYGAITGKKNVASFRTPEMEETMRQAEEIKAMQEAGEVGTESAESVTDESEIRV